MGGLLCVPIAWPAVIPTPSAMTFYYTFSAAFPLLVVGALAAAQRLLSTGAPGLGAAVASLVIGFGLFGRALPGTIYQMMDRSLSGWHVMLVVAGLAAVAPAAWRWRRGDPAAVGLPDDKAWTWKRLRLIVTGGLVSLVALPFAMISTERLAAVLEVSWRTLVTYPTARAAMLGGMTLAAAVILSTLAGLWPLAGALTAATAQIAVSAPLAIALLATSDAGPTRWFGALLGVAIGAAAAANRWRIAAAATLSVGAATCLFIAFSATSGQPQKLVGQQSTTPALLMLVLATAAATAVVGATAPVLAPRGAVPAVLGPISGVLVMAGVQTAPVIYLRSGASPRSISANLPLDTAGVLLLVSAAAIGGLGIAHYLSERWAERKRAELIRQEAAAAERDRLARPIHDGVLQVLALVQREGSELGGAGAQLAALAGEQEVALRNLLSGNTTEPGAATADLRAKLSGLSSPAIDVSAPADPVILSVGPATEIFAAVQAALDNVRQHAGPGARAWILLEDEGTGVRVTVRDDGVGFEPHRLQDAARSGRLGVEQSMRGRVHDLGGTTTIKSRPGRGTEVEFWIPRQR
ncbi:ATP-binding protein [Dactylosporangium sp. AC04546]|uniref:sensor histidine kinase n=1 Tax=Dactylosporangium sp. AC04546 TaxID=2862460 RepID=UPI002E7AE25B|nr:ATP-binding protein [Dactylosporangium sp. AC04546]WVK87022.1 ATP-binding protein [Dactylosporangium sp. AC04546]